MMPPSLRTLPLLVQLLAAAMLTPVALAKPKSPPPAKQADTAKKQPVSRTAADTAKKPTVSRPAAATPAKKTQAQKDAEIRAAVAAGKAAGKKPTQAPAANSRFSAPPPIANAAALPAGKSKRYQTAGDNTAPAGKKTAPQSPPDLIADPAELLSRVPTSGPLGEEHLILLAIANSPVLERRRADIASARAERRTVQDWENPELRLSYSSQDDDYIDRPYTERSIEQYTANETAVGNDSTTSLAGPGQPGFGTSTLDSNNSTTSTNRYREIERIITPGKNGSEEVVTNIYELRTEDENGFRDRIFNDGVSTINTSDALASHVTRTLTSTSRETTTSTQRGNGSDTFSALIRFRIPNPWERKARIQRASAEIMLAEGQYLSDEDRLVREIRERYDAIGMLESVRGAQEKIRTTYGAYEKEMLEINQPEFIAEPTRAKVDIRKAGREIHEADVEILRLRAELATLTGLQDPSRIRSGSMKRRSVDSGALEVDYLTDIGMLYRADAVESRGRLEIAKAHLAEAKATRIPFATFLDAGYTRETGEGRRGSQDEWEIRLGISLPIWDLFGINKKVGEHKKAAAAWELQYSKQRQKVQTDVTLAIRRLRAAASNLDYYDKDLSRIREDIKNDLPKIQEAMARVSDYGRLKRTKYELEVEQQEVEISRYKALSEYNQSLIFLEDAIGVRVEKALNGVRLDGGK
ncbi:MAG TPA: TolC family protein [Verrucomicrobiales bacterium]|jgi:outer membrane protein TolC|nr:TolC family protein [Verrucomicrobiales bacterium]